MGIFWDNPDSPEVRRRQEADARRRAQERESRARKERAKLEKQRQDERKAQIAQQHDEDERAINEMAKKMQGETARAAAEAKAAWGLSRGPGLGGSPVFRNPNAPLPGGAPQIGFNPNAPRDGQEPETGTGKGGGPKGSGTSGAPKLPRPF